MNKSCSGDPPFGIVANLLVIAISVYAWALLTISADLYYLAIQEDEYLEWASFWAFAAASFVFLRKAFEPSSSHSRRRLYLLQRTTRDLGSQRDLLRCGLAPIGKGSAILASTARLAMFRQTKPEQYVAACAEQSLVEPLEQAGLADALFILEGMQ